MEESHVIIACRIMQPELDFHRSQTPGVEVRYLPQNLHRTPDHMAEQIQKEIDDAAAYADQIILGYGLCSNGTLSVRAPHCGLVMPRVHDCIALFLGSRESYQDAFLNRPGVYYLTPGWIRERKDPLGVMREDYTPRVGAEFALETMQLELRHYTHIALIDTGAGEMEASRAVALENARFFGKEYTEIKGDPSYFRNLIEDGRSTSDFVHLAPGEEVTQDEFIGW